MKRTVFGAAIGASLVLLVAAGSGQSLDDLVERLARQVASLDTRVSRLEHAAGAAPMPQGTGGSGQPAAGATAVRTMIVDGISQAENTDDNAGEIAQLQSQIGSMQETLTGQQNQLSQISGQSVGSGLEGQNVVSNRGSVDRQIESQRGVVDRYQTQLGIKRDRLQRLQDAATQPKQVIHGHEGDVIITLDSKFNLGRDLESIDVGDTVTWTGTRISSGSGSETWRIDSIRKVR